MFTLDAEEWFAKIRISSHECCIECGYELLLADYLLVPDQSKGRLRRGIISIRRDGIVYNGDEPHTHALCDFTQLASASTHPFVSTLGLFNGTLLSSADVVSDHPRNHAGVLPMIINPFDDARLPGEISCCLLNHQSVSHFVPIHGLTKYTPAGPCQAGIPKRFPTLSLDWRSKSHLLYFCPKNEVGSRRLT